MATYASVQDVLDTNDKAQLQKKLTQLNVDFKPQHGEKTLAGLLFEAVGTKPTENVTSSSGLSNWEQLGSKVKKKVSKIKAGKPTEKKDYIHKYFNFRLAPLGVNKKGKSMRYVKGYSSLLVEEQKRQGDVFNLEHIVFKGIEGTTFEMDGFVGRSILTTSDKTLQEFIETHQFYGNMFVLYDRTEINRRAYEEDVKITDIKYAINHASDEELICTMSFLNMRQGKNNYNELMKITDSFQLKRKASRYAEVNPDLFLEATESKEAKVVMMVNIAKDQGLIVVSSDETIVKSGSNGNLLCKSSRASDWQDDMKNFLLTPEGRPLAQRLELQTGYRVF